MKFARIVDGIAADVVEADSADKLGEMFHPDLVAQFQPAPDGSAAGWVLSDGALIPSDTSMTFYVDATGTRYTTPGEGRAAVTGPYYAPLARDGAGWRLATAEDLATQARDQLHALSKAECRRRILAVISSNAQMNLAAAAAGGILTKPQMTAFRAGVAWIGAMRNTAATLADAGDEDFPQDDKWPDVPEEAIALAQLY
jgi:hypothetical protein